MADDSNDEECDGRRYKPAHPESPASPAAAQLGATAPADEQRKRVFPAHWTSPPRRRLPGFWARQTPSPAHHRHVGGEDAIGHGSSAPDSGDEFYDASSPTHNGPAARGSPSPGTTTSFAPTPAHGDYDSVDLEFEHGANGQSSASRSAGAPTIKPPQRRPMRHRPEHRQTLTHRLANTAPRPSGTCGDPSCSNDSTVWCDTCMDEHCTP